MTYFRIWPFGGAKYQGGDKAEARGTDEQPLSIKPPLIRCGETYSAWQKQFKDTKVCVKEMTEKSV